jgi:hypothetical protein
MIVDCVIKNVKTKAMVDQSIYFVDLAFVFLLFFFFVFLDDVFESSRFRFGETLFRSSGVFDFFFDEALWAPRWLFFDERLFVGVFEVLLV